MDRGGYGHPPQLPIRRALLIVHGALIGCFPSLPRKS